MDTISTRDNFIFSLDKLFPSVFAFSVSSVPISLLRISALFSPPAVGSLQGAENDVYCLKNRGRRYQRKDVFLLPDAESDTAGIL